MSNLDNIKPPAIIEEPGALHPINQTKDYLLDLLANMGFNEVYGPEIETEEFNFDMLTIKNHILQDKCMILFMLKVRKMS